MQLVNPDSITKPASNYSQGVLVSAGSRRVIVSGQCGVTVEGAVLDGTAAQMRQAFSNVLAVVDSAGLSREHLVKVTVFLTSADDVAIYRDIRDDMLKGHVCASTLIVVSALADPRWTVEIEAEACE